MTISPLSSSPPIQHVQSVQNVLLAGTNDHDGDEINGVDPAGEKNKAAAIKNAASTGVSFNPNLGNNLNTTA